MCCCYGSALGRNGPGSVRQTWLCASGKYGGTSQVRVQISARRRKGELARPVGDCGWSGQDGIRISSKRGCWRVCPKPGKLGLIVRQRSRPVQGLGLKEADSE